MIHIGCKFTGKPQHFIDTANGVFWESLPAIDGQSARIQQALIKTPAEDITYPVARPKPSFWHRAKRTLRIGQA